MVKDRVLRVFMNGLSVGRIVRSRKGLLSFAYAPSWLESPYARPVSLSMPLTPVPYEGEAVRNFLQNLLPDNGDTLARIQARFRCESQNPFDLLSAAGRDCAGAIQFYPEDTAPYVAGRMTSRALSSEAVARLLADYPPKPLGMSAEDDFRITLSGAQEKTALLKKGEAWRLPLGGTPTTHIIKAPLGALQPYQLDFSLSCENGWLCLEIARAFGLDAARSEVARFGEVKALVLERFDRRRSADGTSVIRLPAEDLCQALGVPPGLRRESDGGPGIAAIMGLLRKSERCEKDREAFMAAQVLFWMLEAQDGHAKNFSVFIGPGGAFRLAPLYDILSASPLIATGKLKRPKVKLAMNLLGKNRHNRISDIEPQHFVSTARACGMATETMTGILERFARKADEVSRQLNAALPADFPKAVSCPVFDSLRSKAQKIEKYLTRER